MAVSSVVVMAAFVASKVIGLLRDRAIAEAFGAGPETDAYFAALRVPDLLFTLVAGGALVSAFLPVFSEALANEEPDRAWRLCGGVTNLALAVTIVLAVSAALLADPLLAFVAPGFSEATRQLSADLMRILLVSTVIFAVSGLQMGILNAFHHFLLPALAPAVYNLGLWFGAVALAPRYGIRGLAYGALIGAAGHLLVKVPGLVRYGYRYVPTLGRHEPGVAKVVRLMGPRMLGLATVQVVWIVTVRLASSLASGSLAAFQFAWALAQMPQTLLGTAVGVVAFPTLADMAARQQRDELRATIALALRSMLAAAVPAAIALYLLAGPAVELVLVTGRFSDEAAAATTATLRMLALGLVAHIVFELLARAFYAEQDTVRPLYFAAFAMIVNVALAIVLVTPMGVSGIALANSVAVIGEVLLAYEVLRRRLGGLNTPGLLRAVAQIGMAGLLMAATIRLTLGSRLMAAAFDLVLGLLPDGLAPTLLGGAIRLGMGAGIGGLVYVVAAWSFGLSELRLPIRRIVSRLTARRQAL